MPRTAVFRAHAAAAAKIEQRAKMQTTTENDAFYAGRNSWFPGERVPTTSPFADPKLAAAWRRGLRQVLAEERLDADEEWD